MYFFAIKTDNLKANLFILPAIGFSRFMRGKCSEQSLFTMYNAGIYHPEGYTVNFLIKASGQPADTTTYK